MRDSYRNDFREASQVEYYDQHLFSETSYGSLLWSLERQYLEDFLRRFSIPADRIHYLDFACGTGRVLAFMESKVMKATGIEISPAMLELARQRTGEAELINADITDPDAPVEKQYDLITAFRFVLNAEPELRLEAMRSLAARLKDDRSRLIFNVHGNLPSHKLLMWSKHRFREVLGKQPSRNYLTRGQVEELAEQAGLEIVETMGYDLSSSKGLYLLSYGKLLALERWLMGRLGIQKFGGHQIYVARKKRYIRS